MSLVSGPLDGITLTDKGRVVVDRIIERFRAGEDVNVIAESEGMNTDMVQVLVAIANLSRDDA